MHDKSDVTVGQSDAKRTKESRPKLDKVALSTLLGLTWPATLWVLVADYLYGSKGTEQGQEEGQKTEAVAIYENATFTVLLFNRGI
ncbi:Hypp9235 [Branchiostoma lanceolatum]|uniref:Hypp9235 protein n=1 Tax=Branchiostoma lanceolatum TaxID=7740 RepID=A0A8J9ZEH0_BRALA|nr:Hypp9235 [Branchiostoma lanceolatum]